MKYDKKFLLNNEVETKNLGKMLAENLQDKPALIFLQGEMGAGKTTLAQGFIQAIMQGQGIIHSPSFSYMNTYFHKRAIYHFDLYRIDENETIFDLGLDEFINDEEAIRLIEWPDRFLAYKPPDMVVNLLHQEAKRVAYLKLMTHA